MRRLDPKMEDFQHDRSSPAKSVSGNRCSPGYGNSFLQTSKSKQDPQPALTEAAQQESYEPNGHSTQTVPQQKSVLQKEEAATDADNRYQLSSPSLLQPQDPYAKYRLGDYRLKLDPAFDPQFQAMVTQRMYQLLDPVALRPLLQQVPFMLPPTPGNIFSIPPVPAQPPLVPRGAGPDIPKTASASDLLDAVLKIPSIDQAVTTLRDRALITVSRDWRQLSTPAKIGVVSAGVLIVAPTLAGIISDPAARSMALDQLNGKVIPVPGVNWLSVETNLKDNNLIFGLHVDVGRLLPPILGFGPSSPAAIGKF
ncbi:hypothetical protein GXP67_29530 [Rhodocytophaga rosea]|uniref:Uncharacterized protein n=1 Tax=Rhodocytophaga rosea TaxID=2704465 RepID=A0A6C0GR01_9BACT|nr:hypothetical protein [Rhodocytophaga rosea]QHT70498.1 hypothetical protein GXP67_29530 [Rhodocytophaga rosea]